MKLSVIKFIAVFVIAVVTIFYIDTRITAYDMRFYAGKDNGLGVRLLSIFFLSALFFAVMTEKYRILLFVIGFGIGFVSSALTYFVCVALKVSNELTFHIASCVVFSLVYFLLRRKFSELCRKVLQPFSSKPR